MLWKCWGYLWRGAQSRHKLESRLRMLQRWLWSQPDPALPFPEVGSGPPHLWG